MAYLLGFGLSLLFASWPERLIFIAIVGIGVIAGWRAGFPRTALAIFAIFIITGISGGSDTPEPLPSNHLIYHLPSKPTTLEGWVAEDPVLLKSTLQALVRSEWLYINGSRKPASGDSLIQLHSRYQLSYGQRIRLDGLLLSRPRGYANPGGFDFREFLARRDIFVVGRLTKDGSLLVLPGLHPRASLLIRKVSHWRSLMLDTIEKTLPGSSGGVLQAIILGARERLSLKDRALFRNTGTAHLLAISGLHVGFIALAAFWALRNLLRTALRLAPEPWGLRFAPSRWAALGTAPAVLFYALLVGGRVATVRASIMVLVYLASRICRRPRNHFHALALAALLILVWDPRVINDIGFQLSFTAVTAILLTLRRHDRVKEGPLPGGEKVWGSWLKERVRLYLQISLVAFLATWPLIARYFHRIALISPLTNALVFPVASMTIPLGLAAALSSLLLPAAAKALLTPAGWGASLLLVTLKFMARLSFSNWTISAPSAPAMVVYYVTLTSLLIWLQTRRRGWLILVAGILLIGATTAAALQNFREAGRLTITALDADRSQAIILGLPDGRKLLWFGAPSNGNSYVIRQIVVPTLLHKRIRVLHGLIAANNTEATARGLLSLAQKIEVKQIWLASKGDATWPLQLGGSIKRLDLPVRKLQADWSEPCGKNCSIRALWPTTSSPASREGSFLGPVLYIRYNQRGALLTGDSSYRVERAIIAGKEPLDVTLLQVPKAGSRYASSASFLRYVRPELAMLVARAPWSWRDDVKNTLERYDSLGIPVWRVDRSGALIWETDGESSSIRAVRLNGAGFLRPHRVKVLGYDRSR